MGHEVGDKVVYLGHGHGTSPAARAIRVQPAPHGGDRECDVLKHWVVHKVLEGDMVWIVARTGSGGLHCLEVDGRRVRKPSWWERWLHRWPELTDEEKALVNLYKVDGALREGCGVSLSP